MAGLFRNCEDAEHDAKVGRMAAPPLPDVHLEAMEETENAGEKPDETGTSGMAGL